MATDFPTGLDTLANPASSDKLNNPSHAEQHENANDAIEALQAKVGIDSSAVTSSHDYKLSGVADGTKAVSLTGTETLTNKTLTTPIVATLYQDAGKTKLITFPAASDTLVGKDTTDTLTNKTLTTPTIGDFTNATHDHSSDAEGGSGIDESDIVFGASGHDHSGTTNGNLIPTEGIEDAAIETAKIADANVTAAKIAAETWTEYEPSWTVAGQSPTVGNGTLVGHYIQYGKTVIATVKFLWGSTTSAGGSGNWQISLPVNCNSSNYGDDDIVVGTCNILNYGTTSYPGFVRIVQSTNCVRPTVHNSNAARTVNEFVEYDDPMTWTTNDYMSFTIVYEAA